MLLTSLAAEAAARSPRLKPKKGITDVRCRRFSGDGRAATSVAVGPGEEIVS